MLKTWWVRCFYTDNEGQSLYYFGPFPTEEEADGYVIRTLSEVSSRLSPEQRLSIMPLIGMTVEAKHGLVFPTDQFWDRVVKPRLLEWKDRR